MNPEFQRVRNETVCKQAPRSVGCALVLALGLLALYIAVRDRTVLGLALFAAFFVLMEAITWWTAHRDLQRAPAPGKQPRVEELRVDRELGRIEWRSEYESWCLDCAIPGHSFTVTLEGSREAGPSVAAKALWTSIEPRVAELWTEVVAYTLAWAVREGTEPLRAQALAPTSLSIAPEELIEGGDIALNFEVASDPDGSYFVPFRRGRPLFVHRDA